MTAPPAGRSFGRSASTVTRYANAFTRGLQSRKVAATDKHFPGFGAASANTDAKAVVISAPLATLRGVVCQRLMERADGKGRTPAVEVLTGTSKVIDCIADPLRLHELEQVLADGQYHGMQTLDQALLELVRDGLISLRDALAVSGNPEDLRIALGAAGVSAAV